MNKTTELTAAEIDQVSGGVIPVVAYAAFVSGAKWGAGIALATLALSIKHRWQSHVKESGRPPQGGRPWFAVPA